MINGSRSRVLASCVTVAALGLTACSGGGTNSASEDGLILNGYAGASGTFVENWNPLSPTVLSGTQGMIYEPLFFFNNLQPATEEPQPILGASFSWNEDGTVLSVETQEGINWSDGEPFSAEDVAFTFNLIRNTPELNTTGTTPEAELVDETHVTLTFEEPSFVSAPTLLGGTYIVPEHIWSEKSDPATDPNPEPVGTGPMMAADFTPQSYLVTKNPEFRNADDVQVGGLRYHSLSGNQAATDKLLAKQLDWAGVFIPDVENVVGNRDDLGLTYFGSQQVAIASCANAELGCEGPQTEQAVRQALSAALDRDQVNQLAYYGNAQPISATYALLERDTDLIAPDLREPVPNAPDVERAKQLLEDAGWTLGSDGIYAKDGERLSMNVQVTTGYTDYITALDAMAQQAKAAGIELVIRQVANSENVSSQGLGNFELAMSGVFQGEAADPYYAYETYFASNNTGPVGESVNPYGNVARYSNPEVDEAIVAAASTEDMAVRAEQYAIIQEHIVEDLPYIPVVNNISFSSYSTERVTGFPTTDDLWASPDIGSAPDNGLVVQQLRPVD
ncbi:ABC transporter substrate-binding protein [Streptomyces sp. 3MP-14]|uniref:ABC transporter substrate-binding protein n=1 Tax=Streptomyces mimosae TaxID=2586635 RepID=A0A5N6A0M2_9ACTN|nr:MULTISPECIES: ABC transporter substrate-binding protein [Streptomyces]KAB8162291.1 ABC transporter substrate-binding protein [Streptomyces mimosae]KAB8173810.1 ABC transporter substrate-binding protein [Streptomyces sp. 3MP-14]